jgi:NADH:ubiquinone oxidoreductase subunit 5 (subunit L)/multisubunit Na+/H+ antiporter MnhA subunit
MYREAFINRLLYLLNFFATSVVFLFFSFDYFLIMLSWECIGLFSLLLVNFYSTRIYTIKAALKTLVFSRISDTFMFISFILSIVVYNTTDLSIIFLQVPFLAFHYSFFGSYGLHFLTLFSFLLATSGCVWSPLLHNPKLLKGMKKVWESVGRSFRKKSSERQEKVLVKILSINQ